MTPRITGIIYFVICRTSHFTFEAPSRIKLYYDPGGQPTGDKAKAAKFLELIEAQKFVQEKGIRLDDYCFICSQVFEQ